MKAFQPVSDSGVTLAATEATANVKLGGQPRTGEFQVRVVNAGPNNARIKFGDKDVIATGDDMFVPVGVVEILTVPGLNDGDRFVAAICSTGTAALEFHTGAGV